MASLQDESCTSKVELSISCHHLINMDTLSLSDPIVVAYEEMSGRWVERGRTEMIKDNLNPKFLTSILVDYRFEEIQNYKFVCYDVDNPHQPLDRQDFIGEMKVRLSEVITARGQIYAKELTHPNHPRSKRGNIIINAEEKKDINDNVKFQICGRHLDKKDFFGKSDPFIVVSRQQGNQWVPVYKSDVIKNTLDPTWQPFAISMQKLCNGDQSRPLQFEIFDWNKSSPPEIIGSFKTTLSQILNERKEFDIIEETKRTRSRSYKNSGILKILDCQVVHTSTFIEYLRGGCELSLVVAVDFTASNGAPANPTSLHNITNQEPNEYVKAITTVGEILSAYDADKMFPVYGFGAKIPPSGEVSHCFPLNGNPQQPEVPGVQGILNSYYQALNAVTLYGPTMFSEILRASSYIASQTVTQQQQKYFIFLILTDGVINDIHPLFRRVNHFDGVGNADFANMKLLDADDVPLRSRAGAVMSRDIVQFVPFRDFKNSPLAVLAKETLAEIPGQLLQYMTHQRIVPNKALVATQSTLNMLSSQPSVATGLTSVSSAPSASVAPSAPPATDSSSNLNYPQFTLSPLQTQQVAPQSTSVQPPPYQTQPQSQASQPQAPPPSASQFNLVNPTQSQPPAQNPAQPPYQANTYPPQQPQQQTQQPPAYASTPRPNIGSPQLPTQQQSGYSQQPPAGYPPQATQPPTQSGYPPQQQPQYTQPGNSYVATPRPGTASQPGYPPQQGGYAPQPGYQQQPTGYPPQQSQYPPQQGGYPPQQQQQQAQYPPQNARPGYPQQQQQQQPAGYPPQPQQPSWYPPQGQQQPAWYPPQSGYPPQAGYPPQQPQATGYPPQSVTYTGYPPQVRK